MSDYVQIIYGEPGAYGVVSALYPSRTGINSLLEGLLPQENIGSGTARSPSETAAGEPRSEEVIARYTDLRRRTRVSSSTSTAERLTGARFWGWWAPTPWARRPSSRWSPARRSRTGARSSGRDGRLQAPVPDIDFEGTVEEFFLETLGTGYGEPDLQDALAVP